MKIVKTRYEIESINNVLNSLVNSGFIVHPKMKYFVAKNIRLLKDEIQSIEAAKALNSEFLDFQKKYADILRPNLKFDEKGQPIMINGEYQYKEDVKIEEVKSKLKELEDENKEILEKQKADNEKIFAFMNEKIEIELWSVSNSFVPESLDQIRYDILFDLIEE